MTFPSFSVFHAKTGKQWKAGKGPGDEATIISSALAACLLDGCMLVMSFEGGGRISLTIRCVIFFVI